MVLLRKSIPQSHYLQTAAELNVRQINIHLLHMKRRQDIAEIYDLIHLLERAHALRDSDALISLYENDAVVYDLAPPLGRRGINREVVQAWFDTWDGAITLDFINIHLVSTSTIGFLSALNRMRGSKNGNTQDLWFRATLCLRKGLGGWKIAHDHTSVPFYMDGSDKAALDLKPQ